MRHNEIAKMYRAILVDILGIDDLIQINLKKRKIWDHDIHHFSCAYSNVTITPTTVAFMIKKHITKTVGLISTDVNLEKLVIEKELCYDNKKGKSRICPGMSG